MAARGLGSRLAPATALLLLPLLSGCLDEPEIEDRWTRVDLRGASVAPFQALPPGWSDTLSVQTRVTWRSILTGYAVAELRASRIPATEVALAPNAPRLRMATDIDRILSQSVSLGRVTRAVTGWDHLQQDLDLAFTATVPAATDSTGAAVSLFLLVYLGSGEEIEFEDGSDTLIVTPFVSHQAQVLPSGLVLTIGTQGPH
jgi:hypothetical protein